MQSLAWKLVTLAGVVAVGFLVMLQAQRGMNQSSLNSAADAKSAAATGEPPATAPANLSPDSTPPQAKSDTGKATSPQAVHAAGESGTPADGAGLDFRKELPKTADSSAASGEKSTEPLIDDPFAEQAAATRPGRPPASKTPVSVSDGGVKQAAETPGDEPFKTDGQSDAHANASGLAASANPKPAESLEAPPLLDEPKIDARQSEPTGPPEHPAHENGKSSAGPELMPPQGEKSSSAPPGDTRPPGLGADDKQRPIASPNPAMPGDPSEASPSKPPRKTAGEPALLPVPDHAGTSPESNSAGSGPEGSPAGSPSETKKKSNDAKAAPDPFKFTQNDDSRPNRVSSSGERSKARPADRNDEPSSSPDSRPTGRHAAGPHAESNPELQGDGTVGDTAPLGLQRPQLNIEKIAPPNAMIGQPLVYSILVKNVGASTARDVVVEDRIPKGTKLSGTIPRAELTGKKLIWRVGNVTAGEQHKISVRVVPLEAGEVGSVATVNFVAEAAAETVVTAPRLEFELSAKSAARLGEMVPFHFKVRNVGTGEARGVVIRDVIPPGLSHGAGSDLEYEVGRLPAGHSKELTLELKAVKVGPTENRALVTADGGLTAEAKAPLEIVGSKLALSRSGPSRRYLGRPAVYSNTIVNESKHAVDDVVVAESVPAGMEFSSATNGGQYNDGTRTIAWRFDRLSPGETRVVKVKLIPNAAGTLISAVRATVPNGESAEIKAETVVEGFAAISMEVPPIDGPVDVGEKVTFRINVRNKGTVPATSVVATVDVPDQLAVVSVRGPAKHTQAGNQIRFGPIAALDGRTSAACEVVLEARKRGDSRLKVALHADQMEQPLVREESVLILSEGTGPSASR